MEDIKAVWIKRDNGYECSHCGCKYPYVEDTCPYCNSIMEEPIDEV